MLTSSLLTILLIVISFLISLFGSIVGIGGGIFIVPILITFFGYPLELAVGTTMFSLIPSSMMSTFLNKKNGNVDFKMGVLLEIPTIIGVVIGSFLLTYFAPKNLEITFSILVFLLGSSFFVKRKQQVSKQSFFGKLNHLKPRFIIKNKKKNVAYRVSFQMVLFFGLLSGTLAGLFGMGGGFMKTPIMLKVFKIPSKIATATALFMIMITSITGSISHYLQGNVLIDRTWPVMIGFTFGAIVGHKISTNISASFLEKLIGIALIAASMVMLMNFLNH
ncbi:sulfite exporter TauE/SafE family protein [Flavobacterium capsici]|uniref:Probable membrane transporter protein n=1 Tax=Flavobacterium capsici TaxID=3075618 RepID=A0AA96J519_9FLAO|nr:sulfite exporter TauE/SafE family protein [Flavobacterium sp. PMTSA4]WNM22005.1 sulfite exporter TauE/SafE family protein [Flavobacterium sp. PMTSA4]